MNEKFKVFLRVRKSVNENKWCVKEGKLYQNLKNNSQMEYKCFKHVFRNENTSEIYNKFIKESIIKFVNGKNCTIFAYGQTGSGKTFTMVGNGDGLIILSLKTIFGFLKDFKKNINEDLSYRIEKLTLNQAHTDNDPIIKISYIEIYNEQVYDLIDMDKKLKIFSVNGDLVISNLTKIEVNNFNESVEIFEQGEKNKNISETTFNERSSRSHTIFQVEFHYLGRKSILNLIDLAGSEKASDVKERRTEGSYINRSLLALSSVINGLISNTYVNYRDSKLTRILQSSIVGDVELISICMINEDSKCYDETLSTLNFASRMSQIKKKPELLKMNKDENKKCPMCNQIIYTQNMVLKDKSNIKNKIQGYQGLENKIKEIGISKPQSIKNGEDNNLINIFEEKTGSADRNITEEYNEERKLLLKRISTLESLLTSLLAQNPSKKQTEIYLLEKNIFNLQYSILKKRRDKEIER